MKVGERRWRLDSGTVNKNMCFLGGGHALEGGIWKGAFQRHVKPDAQEQWAGLLEGLFFY